MPSLSFAGGVDAAYEVAAGKTSVILSSSSKLNPRGIVVGTGQMVFRWVSNGKSQTWQCTTSMLGPTPVQPTDVSTGDGTSRLMIGVGELFPAGLLLQGRMVGTLVAPAVHIDIPWGRDIWVFLVRSPWFPLRLQVAKPSLEVTHGSSRASASLGVSGGSVAVGLALDGPDFKSASLTVLRSLGQYTSKEPVGEVAAGSQSFSWSPIVRSFDLVLVTHGTISESELAQVASGLGAEENSGFLGAGSMEGDFVLCDGPAFEYALALRGHRGLLENDEDASLAKLTW